MEDDRFLDDLFAASRAEAPQALMARVLADAEAQRPRPVFTWRSLSALAASGLMGLWLGWSGVAASQAATGFDAGLDIVAALDPATQ